MSVLVNPKNEQEEKVLLAFLDSLNFKYEHDVEGDAINSKFLDRYNAELDKADQEIEAGDFISQDDVEQLLRNRRKLD